ncbi:MAG: AI-2E family transporter [Ruminococcaceae bacterium]|nr:AI-2E family transporter [Oscillospiraceae bacterium]
MISFKTLRSLCLDFVIFFIPAILLWMALPKIIAILLPFIFGYVIYLIANPLNRWLKKYLPPSVCAFLSLFTISFLLFFFLWLIFSHLIKEITALSVSGTFYKETLPLLSGKVGSFFSGAGLFGDFLETFRSQISNVFFQVSLWVIDFVKNIPSLLITVFTTVFTAFFLLKDTRSVYEGAKKFFGEKLCLKFTEVKNSFFNVIFTYLKAQLLIESIIFVVLFLGFTVLRIEYALLFAFFTAIVDVFPILGTGTVLIPASVFYFLTQNPVTGWGLLALYGVAILTRQLCEPKIIGSRLGIHPLITIFSIYAGMKLLGFWGIILGPIITLLAKNLIFIKKV